MRTMEPNAAADTTDASLLQRYRDSSDATERRALADQLFALHYERVSRWCLRLCGNVDAAADLAQDVFLKAHRHLASFEGTSQFSTWLYSIARNESINRARRTPAVETTTDEVLVALPALDPTPEAVVAANSRAENLHHFLSETLDATERAVFTLHYGDDMTLDAITTMLDLRNSSGAKAFIVSAKRKLSRAVEKLRARGGSL